MVVVVGGCCFFIISDICGKIGLPSLLLTASSHLSSSDRMSPKELFIPKCKDKATFTFQSMKEMLSLWCQRQSLAITEQRTRQRLLGTGSSTELSVVHVLCLHVM